jgi:hypothetical protein
MQAEGQQITARKTTNRWTAINMDVDGYLIQGSKWWLPLDFKYAYKFSKKRRKMPVF